MSDLVTRITLNNDNFNKNLRESKKQVKDFKGGLGSASKIVGKFGGAITAAVSVVETFTTAINSNARSQNAFNDAVNTGKIAVDNFFSSLINGDWSFWEDGIDGAIDKANKYAVAARNMKKNLAIGDVHISEDEKELNRFENIAIDPNASKADREKAFADFKTKYAEAVQYAQNLKVDTNKNLERVLAGNGIITKDVRDLIFKYIDSSTLESQNLERYIQAKKSAKINNPMRFQTVKDKKEHTPKYYAATNILNSYSNDEKKEFEQAIKLQNELTEEEVNEILDYTSKIVGLEDRIQSVVRQLQGLQADFNDKGELINKDPKVTSKAVKKAVKNEPKISMPTASIPLNLKPQLEVEGMEMPDMSDTTESIIENLERQRQAMLDAYVSPAEQAQYALNGLSNMFGNLGNVIGGSGGAAVEFFGAIMQGTAEMIPQIMALIGAKQGEAMASGTASAAKLPFPANIGAIASIIATILGVFASIPKFANGGVFTGNNTIGDLNIARVNSGEMILNNRQQRQLFKILNNSGVLNSPNNSKVQFVIEGKQLVGVLKNYNNKVNKVI